MHRLAHNSWSYSVLLGLLPLFCVGGCGTASVAETPRRSLAAGACAYSVAISPDGKTVAVGLQDSTVKLWNMATGEAQATLKGHTDAVWTVAFSPSGKVLASGSEDATIRIWEIATGKEQCVLKGHRRWVNSLAFGPDG